MFPKVVAIAGLTVLAGSELRADFSYQETTRITGGSLIAAMKVMGVFSKQARQIGEPVQSTVAIRGDRMVHRSAQRATVIDLASETITGIDLEKKTYTVMTFAEMKQAMEQMSRKMQQQKDSRQPDGKQADVKFKISAENTGKQKQINGLNASERVIKMEMEGTDQKSGQTGAMVVIADSWIAPKVPGYEEVQAFYRKMAQKIDWSPNSNLFMTRPEVMQGMAEVSKESAKLEGIPVFQTVTMGAEGTVPADGSSAPAAQPQPAADRPTVGGALGSALGGKFGLGRKKPQQDPPSSSAPAAGSSQSTGSLMEMTTEMSGFSSGSVDAAQFEVPAGFKKVENELKRAAQ